MEGDTTKIKVERNGGSRQNLSKETFDRDAQTQQFIWKYGI